jgi:hypothetical protein
MMLSRSLSLLDATKSQTALRLAIGNTPTSEQIDNMRRLAERVYEPITKHFTRRPVVSSMFRSRELNRAVRGRPGSQHMLGEAMDIEIPGIPNWTLYEWILRNLEFDQLVLEFHRPEEPSSGWVHVSYRHGKNRHEALKLT